MTATGRAVGVLQAATDGVQGVAHEVRSGDAAHHPSDREAAAHERWQAGLGPRNQFERDHFRQLEHEVNVGRNHLDRVAERASVAEAAREAEAAEAEAGQ